MPQNPQTPIDPYEALFDDLSEGLTEPSSTGGLQYRGFLTPFPESWLPDFIKDGYNNSLEGLYEQISTGQKAFDVDENYDPNFLQDIGSTVISYSQPADLLALGLGGGFGGLALKATTKQAATALVKSGMKKELSNLLKK